MAIEHGTANSYNNKKCRCRPCKAAWAQYIRRRYASDTGESGRRRNCYEAHPERQALKNERKRLKRFGLSQGDYRSLMETQAGSCAICGGSNPARALCIDHDHQTGAIRGLLCDKCNRGLGLLGDSADSVRLALQYLETA